MPLHVWQGQQDRFVPSDHDVWLGKKHTRGKYAPCGQHDHLSPVFSYDRVLDHLIAAAAVADARGRPINAESDAQSGANR